MDNSEVRTDGITRVPLAQLRRRHQVRCALDVEHVDRLSAVHDRCPPILISADGFLVDGEHRARKLGLSKLPALMLPVDCTAAELLYAIEANTSHGLPLTREERRDAVAAELAAEPAMSDREIARVCGVSRSVVAIQRAATRRSGGSNGHLNGRIGGDGKRYGTAPPSWPGHLEALVRVDPSLTVRAIAERTGASVGAVQARRREVLTQIDEEPRIVRWWRRVRARWALRSAVHASRVNRRAAP